MHELETKTELNERLKEEVAVLHRKVGVCRHQMGLLYEDFHKEREEWKGRERDMNEANARVKEKLAGAGAKVEAYEDQGCDSIHLRNIMKSITTNVIHA